MKNYEKPTIALVELSANSSFCTCNDNPGGGIVWPGLFTIDKGCEWNEDNVTEECKMGPASFAS